MRWSGVICLSVYSVSQITLTTAQSQENTSMSVLSQLFMKLHHITIENRPAQIPEILVSIQTDDRLFLCFTARATTSTPVWRCRPINTGRLFQGHVTRNFFIQQLFVTRPSQCLQFSLCRGGNPQRVKLMDCDKAQIQIIALTWVVW